MPPKKYIVEDRSEEGEIRVSAARGGGFLQFNIGHAITILGLIIGGAMEWQHQKDDHIALETMVKEKTEAIEARLTRVESEQEAISTLKGVTSALSAQTSDLKDAVHELRLSINSMQRRDDSAK